MHAGRAPRRAVKVATASMNAVVASTRRCEAARNRACASCAARCCAPLDSSSLGAGFRRWCNVRLVAIAACASCFAERASWQSSWRCAHSALSWPRSAAVLAGSLAPTRDAPASTTNAGISRIRRTCMLGLRLVPNPGASRSGGLGAADAGAGGTTILTRWGASTAAGKATRGFPVGGSCGQPYLSATPSACSVGRRR